MRIKNKVEKSARHQINLDEIGDVVVRQVASMLGRLDGQRILICAGKGETGTLGLSAAVKLLHDGARPHILLALPQDDFPEEARIILSQADNLHVPITAWVSTLPTSLYDKQDLIIDALSGAEITGSQHYPLDQIIQAINNSRTPVLSLGLPSGLDPKSGKPGRPTVVAMVTLGTVVPTDRLLSKEGALFVGKVATLR